MKIRDVMTTRVVTVQPDCPVGRVIETLLGEDVSSVVVVDVSGRVVGLVAESVLLIASVDPQLRADPISLHMERKFVSASPEEAIAQTVEKFLLHRVRHFPVVEEGNLVGIITRRQLIRALMSAGVR